MALVGTTSGGTIYVPDDYPTIQAAIDAAANGDEIIVRSGVYQEALSVLDTKVRVRSEKGPEATTIDGEVVFSVVSGASLEGFTIDSSSGNTVYVTNFSSVLIDSNKITGRIEIDMDSAGTISNNRISGSIVIEAARATIDRNTICGRIIGGSDSVVDIYRNIITGSSSYGIYGNWTSFSTNSNIIAFNGRAGVYLSSESYFYSKNDTIFGNTSTQYAGGIVYRGGSFDTQVDIQNTILWGNSAGTGYEIYMDGYGSEMEISHCDIEGGLSAVNADPNSTLNWKSGNIDADPLFVDSAASDFHLTWDSPCRDVGLNTIGSEDFEGDPRIALGTVDIGADEFYYHLYHVGEVVPGSQIDLKFVGYPTAPVTLAFGAAILDPPLLTQHGNLHIWPFVWSGVVGNIQGDGTFAMTVTVPLSWNPGDKVPLQSLIGPWGGPWSWLTNLDRLVVE